MDERRGSGSHRKRRVALGASSSPFGIVLAWWLYNAIGWTMTEFELIAFSSFCGSVTAAATICFWDLRGMFLSRVHRRREED